MALAFLVVNARLDKADSNGHAAARNAIRAINRLGNKRAAQVLWLIDNDLRSLDIWQCLQCPLVDIDSLQNAYRKGLFGINLKDGPLSGQNLMRVKRFRRIFKRYHCVSSAYRKTSRRLGWRKLANLQWMLRRGCSTAEICQKLNVSYYDIRVCRRAYALKFFM